MPTYKVPEFTTFEFQKPVETKTLSSPPVSPVKGKRYIVKATGADDWSGQDNNIMEYNGATWDIIPKRAGMIVYIKDETAFYKYITSWTVSGI
jgi:hypothetical protein